MNVIAQLLKRVLRVATLAIAVVVFVGVVAFGARLALWVHGTGAFRVQAADFDPIRHAQVRENTLVLDRQGNRIGEVFDRYQVFVPYAELPKPLIDAILAIEDRKYFQHKGVDPRGILRATWVAFRKGEPTQGGSTITQQLVRHFLLKRERTIVRKLREIALAYGLEKEMSKSRILELYCNEMFLGNGAYGVGAAALRYFGLPLQELSVAELALIAGLFQSPSLYNPERFQPRALARQKQVLRAMVVAGFLSPTQEVEARLAPIRFKRYSHFKPHPYFLDYVQAEATAKLGSAGLEGRGLRLHTTLDPELQKLAEKTVAEAPSLWIRAWNESPEARKSKEALFPTEGLEVSLVALDPSTGELLAMVGGRNYEKSQFNRVASSLRSPGSAFKPVVYSLALQSGWNWNSVQYVAPVTMETYRPRNLKGDYLTETTLLRSFYRSLNTPTVELASELGVGRLLEHAKKLGVQSPLRPELGTALGGSEVTGLDMARVFATLANAGTRTDLVGVRRVDDREHHAVYTAPLPAQRSTVAMTPQVAFLTTEGLRTVLQYGTGASSHHLAGIAVGKTGTSDGAKDNWFCGYTSNLVVIVWVGTDGNEELPRHAMASSLALPLWDAFVTQANRARPAPALTRPPGIRDAKVHSLYGNRVRNGMTMYFLSGREPKEDMASPLQLLSEKKSYRRLFE